MRLHLGDITQMNTDAIVNAAAADLKRCPGICDAIFAAADTKSLEDACKKIGHCKIGHAVVTPAFGLPSKYIIHVAGAGWYGGGLQREKVLFESCYRHALQKAFVYQCKSVAVPLMFSGDYHIPRIQAIKIAGAVIKDFETRHSEMDIVLVLYKQKIFDLAKTLLE